MKRAARIDPDRTWREISVVLTDDAGISALNEKFLGDPGATDVLSFGYDPLPGEAGGSSGEIVVSLERARTVATERRGGRQPWDTSRELALYLAHGCDHLAGEDDRDEKARKRMRRRELRWLREADGLGLTSGLVAGQTAPRRGRTKGR